MTREHAWWKQGFLFVAGGSAALGALLALIGLGLAAIQWSTSVVMDQSSLPPATVTQIIGENAAVLPIYLTLALFGVAVCVVGLVLSLLAWLLLRGDRRPALSV